jgi:hypothetical protein
MECEKNFDGIFYSAGSLLLSELYTEKSATAKRLQLLPLSSTMQLHAVRNLTFCFVRLKQIPPNPPSSINPPRLLVSLLVTVLQGPKLQRSEVQTTDKQTESISYSSVYE